MRFILYILFFVTVLNWIIATPSCSFVDIGGRKYYFEADIETTWIRANKFCKTRGMRLLQTPFDSEDFSKVKDYVSNNGTLTGLTFWVAASNFGSDNFYWISSFEPFDVPHLPVSSIPNYNCGTGSVKFLTFSTLGGGIQTASECHTGNSNYFICEEIPSCDYVYKRVTHRRIIDFEPVPNDFNSRQGDFIQDDYQME